MANLKEIRTRIASVASTRQITSAMKMVAAARLKKAQDTVTYFRPYANKMQEIIMSVAASVGTTERNKYIDDRDYREVLIVVITSNRGLCGAFNSNVIKEALQFAEKKYGNSSEPVTIRYMAIGKKGFDALRKRKVLMEAAPKKDIIENPTFDNAAEVSEALMENFVSKRFDCIDIIYNEFVNAANQKVVSKQFLPLIPEEQQTKKDGTPHIDYIFEPSKRKIISELIPLNLRVMFYEALLDSIASEFGARMTSMHQATDNATTLIQDLTLQYNKARQAAITNEILEIVGGAEALKG